MEILHTVAEAVFLSFLMGAVVGGVVVAHFQLKPADQEHGKLQPAKVKVSDHDH